MIQKTEDMFDVGGKEGKTNLIKVPVSIHQCWQEFSGVERPKMWA